MLLLCSLSLPAQITIPASTLPAIGDKLKYSWAYDQATFDMITAPGFDLSWDFTALTADESEVEEYFPPSQGSSFARFPTANIMTINAAGVERYFVVSSAGLRLLGWVEKNLFGEPFTVVYDLTRNGVLPGIRERFTPFNFFDIYSESANVLEGFRFIDLPQALRNAYLAAGLTTTDSIRLRYAYTQFQSCDAYGTATIPGPQPESTYPVLRGKRTLYREGRVDAHVIPLGWLDITDLTMQYFPASIPAIGIDTSGAHIFYNDLTKEEIARLPVDSEGRPQHVRYKNNTPPSCFDPDLVNATLNGNPIAAGSYAASQTITSAGRVAAGSTVAFTAGITISLMSGFKAETGSTFSAQVISCPAASAVITSGNSEISTPARNNDQPELVLPYRGTGSLQVSPNPVSTSAKIAYTMPEPGPIWMGISDASGRLVEVLETTNWKDPGTYSVEWSPRNTQPGVFYVLLKTAEGVSSKKIVLVR